MNARNDQRLYREKRHNKKLKENCGGSRTYGGDGDGDDGYVHNR